MSRKTVTFRSQTMGNISDLIRDEGLVCQESQSLLNFLAGELLDYQDEGRKLSPTILFCTDAVGIFSGFPVSVRHEIGKAPLVANSIKQVLKQCAPLAVGSWNIYIERTSSTEFCYGVFSYVASPTTIPLREAIGVVQGSVCLLLRKTGASTIEVKGAKGNELALVFSTTREEESQPANPILPFARSCCRDIPTSSTSQEFRIYFGRLLELGLTQSHGAILTCSPQKALKDITDLQDGIVIAPKLDFYAAYSAYRTDGTAESILRLKSAEELLGGILQSDGIVLFDSLGSLIAYRIFFRPSSPPASGPTIPTGGARRRAFDGVKKMVGDALSAALFRSQDGLTIVEGGE